ncbi:rho guanine nucleotide exchange factor 19 isoform X1 [Xyrichtys novacula]|uniref:Rho guanine nucleotide exchange factor 19 isoform X1 n=1 Tax=Xyrichtys novacula TaxID=13765 RepID=A0AAV1EPJ8_XYRNO|nr:rho guanine nucleotide exchange factor 19 isoform X1 [Xyrichtys novacula]
MAQFQSSDENSHGLSPHISTAMNSFAGNSHLVSSFFSQTQTMRTKDELPSLENNSAEDSGGLDERSDSPDQTKDCSLAIDISSALRCLPLIHTLDLKEMFTVSPSEEDKPASSLLDDQDDNTEGPADPADEEETSVTFQSKFIDFFPLYQDYCLQGVKEDIFRLTKSFVSELITPQYLQGLQSRFSPSCESEATPPQSNPNEALSSPLPQPIRVTPCTLWQDLEEVKASGLLGSLTNREIRLQESMFELIGSEASYLRSLRVAVNHFYTSKELRKSLSKREHHVLFSNICGVMATSEKFLMDLEIRLGESVLMSQVGDIVLQHCPEFHSLYVPYVINMMYQEALINQLLQQNRDFLNSIKKLEGDKVCQRQSLKSFLVLPFQRITRVKLILESILKLTEPGSDSVLNLERAIEAIHEIVSECNKGVEKMKQIEQLVSLEMQMDFGKVKSVPLVANGRFLVHQGPVRQLTLEASYSSKISFLCVHLHLFNDLLIISSKKDQGYTVLDHAEFPTHVRIEPMKAEVLGLPRDSFLLHLTRSQTGQRTAMILLTNSRSDKEEWIRLLSRQQ